MKIKKPFTKRDYRTLRTDDWNFKLLLGQSVAFQELFHSRQQTSWWGCAWQSSIWKCWVTVWSLCWSESFFFFCTEEWAGAKSNFFFYLNSANTELNNVFWKRKKKQLWLLSTEINLFILYPDARTKIKWASSMRQHSDCTEWTNATPPTGGLVKFHFSDLCFQTPLTPTHFQRKDNNFFNVPLTAFSTSEPWPLSTGSCWWGNVCSLSIYN